MENIENKQSNIEDNIVIYISEDRMTASMKVIEPAKDDIELYVKLKTDGKDIAIKKLKDKKICYGVNEEIIKSIFKNEIYNKEIVIAKGKKAVKGRDGKITYYFNLNVSKKPKLMPDGSVDFHNLEIIQNVEKGSTLVSYIPHIDNIEGMDVCGKLIKLPPIKKYTIMKGKNTKLSDDKLKLYADKDGNVEIIDGKVCISDILEIRGDVDSSTGDIFFRGDIVIHKNIISGYTVKATGSVSVNGFVEAAFIITGGDVILKNGIQGSGKGVIKAGGNIVAKFAESVDIYAQGNITIGTMLNCNVESEGDIVSEGRRGFIIGGCIHAHNSIRAMSFGNIVEIPTTIEVGFTQNKIERFIILKNQIERLKTEIDSIDLNLKKISGDKKLNLMRKKVDLDAQYRACQSEYFKLEQLKKKESAGIVEAKKNVHPKVGIYIESKGYMVKDIISNAKFVLLDGNIVNTNE